MFGCDRVCWFDEPKVSNQSPHRLGIFTRRAQLLANGLLQIVAQSKVFGFDTGLVCYARGWDHLRTEDCGGLWEHLVLDTLIAAGLPKIHFWRDKQQREVDFVVPRGCDAADAIECKWRPESFEARGLAAFREQYPKGKNYMVSPLNGPAYERV